MRALLRGLLDQIKGIDMWMAAIPFIRCLIDGHQAKALPRSPVISDANPPIKYCERCKLIYWE